MLDKRRRIQGILPPFPEEVFAPECEIPTQNIPVKIGGKVVGQTTRIWSENGGLRVEMEVDTTHLGWDE